MVNELSLLWVGFVCRIPYRFLMPSIVSLQTKRLPLLAGFSLNLPAILKIHLPQNYMGVGPILIPAKVRKDVAIPITEENKQCQ